MACDNRSMTSFWAARPELLARSLALALGDAAFRAHVKDELDRSPFREHKVSFQRFLAAGTGAGGAPSLPWRGAAVSRPRIWPGPAARTPWWWTTAPSTATATAAPTRTSSRAA